MAPGQPIPSSAALNALRGLVFTTGCSVALLAEERRRRLNLARSAVENARKLRNAKAKLRQSELSPRRIDSASHVPSTTNRRRRRTRSSPSPAPPVENESLGSTTRDPKSLEVELSRQNLIATSRQLIDLKAVSSWTHDGPSALRCDTPTLWSTRMMQNASRPLHSRSFTTAVSRRPVSEATRTSGHAAESTFEPTNGHPWPDSDLYHPSGAIPLQKFNYQTHLSNTDLGLLIQNEIQRIQQLVEKAKNSKDADRLRFTALNRFIDETARTRSALDLDASLRYLVDTNGLRIQGEWFHKIFNFYAQCPNPRAMLSWLPFCLEHDFFLRPQEMARFYNRCRHHWAFSDEDIDQVYASLAALNNAVATPSTISIQPKETWKDAYVRNSRKLLTQRSWKSCPDAGVFYVMERAAKDHDWNLVWNTFQASPTEVSAPCFRLAVLARIELDRGRTRAAKSLVWSRASMHDVSSAITPLLMAQLEEGVDPRALVIDTLQRGVAIPDMVYNTAARRALDTEGSAQDAIDICYDAARNNGQNNLFYTLFNLRNLAWGFTRLSNYPALEELLDGFVSQPKPHPSSQTRMCREAFKHIMKSIARRALRVKTEASSIEHARVLEKVNQALVHCGGVSKAVDAGWVGCHETAPTADGPQALDSEGRGARWETWQVTDLSNEPPPTTSVAGTKTNGFQTYSQSLPTRSSDRTERRAGNASVNSDASKPELLGGKMGTITAQINVLLAALQMETEAATSQSHVKGWQDNSADHVKRGSRTLGDRGRGIRVRGSGPIQTDNDNGDRVPRTPQREKAVASA